MAIPSKKWVVSFVCDVSKLGDSLWLEVLAANSPAVTRITEQGTTGDLCWPS